MAERERLLAGQPAKGDEARTRVMSADDVARAIRRMAHEILERNHGADDLMIIGMQTGGVGLARRLPAPSLLSRDRSSPPERSTQRCTGMTLGCDRSCRKRQRRFPEIQPERTIVLVDDVLFTGRTVRAALDAIHPWPPDRNPTRGDGRSRPPNCRSGPTMSGKPADPTARWSTCTTTVSTSARSSRRPEARHEAVGNTHLLSMTDLDRDDIEQI